MSSDQDSRTEADAGGSALPVPGKKKRPVTDESGRRRNAARKARRLAEKKAESMPVVAPIDAPVQTRVVDAPLREPSPPSGIVGVLAQPYVVKLLVRRQIAQMYSGSLLGLFWSYIQPATRFGIYYAVFGILLGVHQGTPNFAIHLFCGIVFTHFFAEVFNNATRSIWNNRALVKKMSMPREIFPISNLFVGFYHIFPQILLLIFFCVISGFRVDVYGTLCLLLGLVTITVFSIAMGLLFSAVNVYYRDFQNIVGTINQLMHFMVPMMYPWTRVAEYTDSHPVLYQLYMANPVCNAVILIQRFFWWGVNEADGVNNAAVNDTGFPPDLLLRGVFCLVGSLAFLWIAQKVFSRLESRFPEAL